MSSKASTARSAADAVWERRTQLVKDELAAESAALDARTARLRALRLEKEAQEAQDAANDDEAAPQPRKRAVRRINIS